MTGTRGILARFARLGGGKKDGAAPRGLLLATRFMRVP
jgi:hypothetical protein